MTDLTENMREELHEKLMQHWAQRERDAKRGIHGPGLLLSDSELMAMLRLTRARAAKNAPSELIAAVFFAAMVLIVNPVAQPLLHWQSSTWGLIGLVFALLGFGITKGINRIVDDRMRKATGTSKQAAQK